MVKIRKDDQVIVIAGKDKGKTGRVLHVYPKIERALVENINTVKKAQRPTQANPKGGIMAKEMSIHISNISLIDKRTNKPTRVGMNISKDGSKLRISKKSGEVI